MKNYKLLKKTKDSLVFVAPHDSSDKDSPNDKVIVRKLKSGIKLSEKLAYDRSEFPYNDIIPNNVFEEMKKEW